MPNIVYVLTNPAMPGLVKIGMTDRDDVQRRMNELFTTGVPFPFECVIAKEIESTEAATVESALHRAFHPYRANESREFFQIEPEQAEALLLVLSGRDVTPRVGKLLVAASPEDSAAAEEFKKRQARISREEFLDTFTGSARIFYERVLDLGKYEGMLTTWAAKSFSLYVVSGGKRYWVCYGYASTSYYGRLYTYLAALRDKPDVPSEEIESLRKQAQDSGLFVQSGKYNELAVHTQYELTESQIDEVTQWLWALIQLIRNHLTDTQHQG
ncbi:MAG: GIY-YIG nuclease family protein [Chloroflexi bacterium]|nr:GIY-YIG nuclease family protein [Chloroflexota bacterium]